MFSRRSAWIHRFGLFVALGAAVLVLAGRSGAWPGLRPVTNLLYHWMVLLAAFALLLGVANVAWVHWQRVQQGETEWPFSLVLLIALVVVLVAGLVDVQGASGPLVEWVFDSILVPGQSTLFALTAFFMVAAAYRFLRVRRPGGAWILLAALLTLAVQAPLIRSWLPPFLEHSVDWLLAWPVMAALRGVVLGAALAAILAALRLVARDD